MSRPRYVTTLGQLREKLAHLPDETALFADEGDPPHGRSNDEDDESRFYEVSVEYVFPGTSTQDPAVVLVLGQCWDTEYELQQRLNEYIGWDPDEVLDFRGQLDALPDGQGTD